MQLWERILFWIISELGWTEIPIFNSALEEILLGLEWPGMSHDLLHTEQVKAISTLASVQDCLQCWKGVGRPTRLLPHTKMLLDPNYMFFLWWVYYALEGSICDFSCLFHTGRSWHAYWFSVVFISGRRDLPSDARAFSLTYFEVWKLLIGAK